MGDFIELGIEAADKLVDKHFEKVPDSALHIHTYHPKNLRSSKSRNNNQNSPSSEANSDPDPGPEPQRKSGRRRADREERRQDDMSRSPRSNSNSMYASDSPYAGPIYSREPPMLRPQFVPSPPPIGGEYYALPPSSAIERRRERDWDDNYYSDSYRSPPRRPKAITRRSSSYHGPRDRDHGYESSDDDNRQMVQRRRGDSMTGAAKIRDRAHRYGLKEEIEKNFTRSPAGITGGVVGAVVGGWAAKKAQTATGKDGKYGKTSNAAITALGAAVGGLAVNAIIDKWQDRKEETEKKEKKWEEKFGVDSEGEESDGGRGETNCRSDRGGGRERRHSREYRGERDGRGYAPYN